MRRFLTLKLVVAGLVCLAAVSGQDAPTPLGEQPLADPATGEITTLAAPEEPVAPEQHAITTEEEEEEAAPEPEPELEVEPEQPAIMAHDEEQVSEPEDEELDFEQMVADGDEHFDEEEEEEEEQQQQEDAEDGDMEYEESGVEADWETEAVDEEEEEPELVMDMPQEDIDMEELGDVLGATTLGGDLNEAVYETVTGMAGGLLDGSNNLPMPDGSLLDTAATANNVLANSGGSNGGAGMLPNLDGALPGSGVINNLLGSGDEGVASSTSTGTTSAATGTTAGSTSMAGGDTVMPAPDSGDKAEAEAEAEASLVHLYITSFQCDVDEVMVTEQDNYVTCTVTAESSEGVNSISAAFYNPPMNKRFLLNFGKDELVEGDPLKGTWSIDLTVPKGADQGVWQLGYADQGAFYGLEVVDAKGNVVNYAKAEAAKTITPLQERLTVKSYKGNTAAFPQANLVTSSGLKLFGLSCDLPAVSVTAAPADVPCTAFVVPDEVGLGKVLAYLVGPTGKSVLPLTFDESAERTLIPATNTTEEMFALAGKLTVPMWAEPGSYGLVDAGAFQSRTVSHAGTIRLASSAMMARKPRLQVASAHDKAAPRVSNFYCNQGQKIDLGRKDAVAVNCLLRASDDLSGISYAAMHFVSPSRKEAVEFAFVPPSPGLGPFPNVAVPQVAETVNAQFPPATEPGAWTLARAVVADQSGNYKEYTATELDQLNVQTFFLVQSPSRSFAIEPREGSGTGPVTPGQATSAAPAGSRPSALFLAAAVLSAFLGLASFAL
jgi:hypothetical protein